MEHFVQAIHIAAVQMFYVTEWAFSLSTAVDKDMEEMALCPAILRSRMKERIELVNYASASLPVSSLRCTFTVRVVPNLHSLRTDKEKTCDFPDGSVVVECVLISSVMK